MTEEDTKKKVVETIPIKTLLLGYNDEYGAVLDFLKENKDNAYSIRGISKFVFKEEKDYGECQILLRKMFNRGIVHRHVFINTMYYFNKY